jgi:hypothetical protein
MQRACVRFDVVSGLLACVVVALLQNCIGFLVRVKILLIYRWEALSTYDNVDIRTSWYSEQNQTVSQETL